MKKSTSIQIAITEFLTNIKNAYPSPHTYVNYKSDLLGESGFIASLKPELSIHSPIENLTERHGVAYIQSLLNRGMSAATRARAASCLRSFFGFVAYEYDLPINITKFTQALKAKRLDSKVKNMAMYPGEKIQKILDFTLKTMPHNLEDMRDLAFIWTLTEVGLRVSEACSLKVGQIDRNAKVTFIGKGGKVATLKIGKRARRFLAQYLKARSSLDSQTGLTPSNLPLFARHDQAVGQGKVKPIRPKRAEAIIHKFSVLALGDEHDQNITCHKFRHYFITAVYRHRGDAKAAQDLARHESPLTTSRYIHRDPVDNDRVSEEVFG